MRCETMGKRCQAYIHSLKNISDESESTTKSRKTTKSSGISTTRWLVSSRGNGTLHRVSRSVRPKNFGIVSGFCITAPAQLPATVLPCFRPCLMRKQNRSDEAGSISEEAKGINLIRATHSNKVKMLIQTRIYLFLQVSNRQGVQ